MEKPTDLMNAEVSELRGTSFGSKCENASNDIEEENGLDEGCCSPDSRKTWIGLIIVFLLAVSWVGAQQFAQSAVTSENFKAPFFATWFGTIWMVLCFPIYAVFLFIFANKDFPKTIRESLKIFGPQKIRIAQIFYIVLPFNILWILTNYLYTFSLTYIAATDASAILSSNIAFVYALSFLVLGELVFFSRILASLLCIAGVVLFGYADGFVGGKDLLPGILMALGSAIGAAVYKVIFKKVIGQGRLGQVSLFLTLLGITNTLFLWVVFLILYFTGVEQITAEDIPWSYLCLSALLSLIFNFLVNFGIAFTYPLFISVAMMLGIPLNAAVDLVIRNEVFSAYRLAAALLVVAGFALMMCPDSWNLPFHRCSGVKSTRCYGNQPENKWDEDEMPISDLRDKEKP